MSEGNVQLKLQVGLDLAFLRKDLGKLAQAAAAYYYPINLQVNKRNFTRQLENIGRTLGTRKYNVNVDDTSIKAASIQVDRLAEKLKKAFWHYQYQHKHRGNGWSPRYCHGSHGEETRQSVQGRH
jgi:cysteine synthase